MASQWASLTWCRGNCCPQSLAEQLAAQAHSVRFYLRRVAQALLQQQAERVAQALRAHLYGARSRLAEELVAVQQRALRVVVVPARRLELAARAVRQQPAQIPVVAADGAVLVAVEMAVHQMLMAVAVGYLLEAHQIQPIAVRVGAVQPARAGRHQAQHWAGTAALAAWVRAGLVL